jgi:hypothetical protein
LGPVIGSDGEVFDADFGDWREEQLRIERIWRKDGSGELGTDPTGKMDR